MSNFYGLVPKCRMTETVLRSFNKLRDYCELQDFKGYDPYDGLNSSFFQNFTLVKNSRLARLVWIQLFKRSPINLRPLTGVKKDYNPKALGLFLSGYCNLYQLEQKPEYLEKINFLVDRIYESISRKWSGPAWGYNFDWQARAFFQPKFTPTVVATSFIVNALLDAFEILKQQSLLETARNACNFILKDLNRNVDNDGDFAFSYSPLDKSVIFNASFLGSRMLARVYSFTKEAYLLKDAKKSVRYCCKHQQKNGAWSYGMLPFHQWIDSFHSGYNLECLSDYMDYTNDRNFEKVLAKGFEYYIQTFFTDAGIPKYYHNAIYPIDIHTTAQLIITASHLGKYIEQKELIDKVLSWTIKNMQADNGYFYYQRNRYFSSKIPYIRWAQGWMFYALSKYLLQTM